MIKMWLFMILVFALGFAPLYIAMIIEEKWYKIYISIIFSAIMSMLVTFNIF